MVCLVSILSLASEHSADIGLIGGTEHVGFLGGLGRIFHRRSPKKVRVGVKASLLPLFLLCVKDGVDHVGSVSEVGDSLA